jgi:hypothetical protein
VQLTRVFLALTAGDILVFSSHQHVSREPHAVLVSLRCGGRLLSGDTAVSVFDCPVHRTVDCVYSGCMCVELFTVVSQFTAAHTDANKVIELQPNKAEGYLRLGNVLVAADDFVKVLCALCTVCLVLESVE